MFRSYECSLTMSCSELSCSAHLPKTVLPNVICQEVRGQVSMDEGSNICGITVMYQTGACYYHPRSSCYDTSTK